MASTRVLGRLQGRDFLAWLKHRRRWFETWPLSVQGLFVKEDASAVFVTEDGLAEFTTEGAF